MTLCSKILPDINHCNLVESYINKIFETTDSDKVVDSPRVIDKIAKNQKDEILTEFTKKGYDTAKLEKF